MTTDKFPIAVFENHFETAAQEQAAPTHAHTPGPWRADLDLDGTLRSAENVPICQICDHNQSEANARLIAAAPDMLDALDRIDRIGNGINVNEDQKLTAYALLMKCGRIARAAIAKAEGRST